MHHAQRRLIAYKDISDEMVSRLVKAYEQVPIGDPLDEGVLMGPLINQAAVDDMMKALDAVRPGGEIITGGNRVDRPGFFVEPTIVRIREMLPSSKRRRSLPSSM